MADALNALIDAACRARASAVLLDRTAAHIRVDGRLEPWPVPPPAQVDALISAAQQLGGATQAPWSGTLPRRDVQAIAYGTPYAGGVRLHIRLRPVGRSPMALAALPLDPDVEAVLDQLRGLVLVVGPTGSGVTETLYAMMGHHLRVDRAVLTLESTIEYPVRGIGQTELPWRPGASVGWLQAMMRQDADVILIGEILDRDTADAAAQLGLASGPLVLAGMRAESAPGAIRALLEIGVAPSLVAAALQGVVAQRLVRRLCSCAGAGCARCGGRGYRGQVGVLDWLRIDDAIREQIAAGEITAPCRLRERGLALVSAGLTSLEEVEAATPEGGPAN